MRFNEFTEKIVVSITSDNNTQKGQMLSDDAKNLSVRQTIQTHRETDELRLKNRSERSGAGITTQLKAPPELPSRLRARKKAD